MRDQDDRGSNDNQGRIEPIKSGGFAELLVQPRLESQRFTCSIRSRERQDRGGKQGRVEKSDRKQKIGIFPAQWAEGLRCIGGIANLAMSVNEQCGRTRDHDECRAIRGCGPADPQHDLIAASSQDRHQRKSRELAVIIQGAQDYSNGLYAMKAAAKSNCTSREERLILCLPHEYVAEVIQQPEFEKEVGSRNVCANLEEALHRAEDILEKIQL